MDGDGGFDVLDSGQQQQGTSGGTDGVHPAWNEMLEKVPQELHSTVTPYLQQWNKSVNERFEKVHQEYEPWKPIVKNYDPDTVNFAVQMLSALENDPQMVYKAIGDFYKLTEQQQGSPSAQGQNEPNKELEEKPWLNDLQQLRQENDMLARYVANQQQQQQFAQADAALDKELKELNKKYGEFDERYVLGMLMANKNMTTEQAVQEWQSSIKSYAEKMGFAGPKPFFVSPGGAIPGSNVDIKNASDKETKDVVIQMLQAAAQQNRQ